MREWWEQYQAEPWGESRDDLRHWAAAHVTWGDRQITLQWPYAEPPMTAEEYHETVADLEAKIERNRRRGQRCKN